MLKKLAKYGNSTTLVIDKAILELLNMDESSVVKLQTDGKSLIITPVPRTDDDKISYGLEEAMQAAKVSALQQVEKNPQMQAKLKELSMPAMQQEFKQAFDNHQEAMAKFAEKFASNQEFQDACAALAQKYDPVTQSAEYLRELHTLKMQFFPELAEFNKELAAIARKHGDV